MPASNSSPQTADFKRKKIFLHGVQFRFAFLVAGSLTLLLVFSILHTVFVVNTNLPLTVMSSFGPLLQQSLLHLALAGFIFIGVMTLGSLFMTHRSVGPLSRLEKELRALAKKPSLEPLHVREGDDLSKIVEAINLLLEKKS